ncbi:hypothetical protein CTEN210_16968 [Chaetoceros tenuissimus]|uniref:Uncharacterized protein n=1 Tax=Chaetoceros tenuissimus TaxID=426638 RepID=A0AAD3D9N3_9STRA|nr:hypothetical protein CTEN210_16968 [Chaetoceros tenuissimus]
MTSGEARKVVRSSQEDAPPPKRQAREEVSTGQELPDSEMEESSPMPSAPDSEMEESSPMSSAPDSEMEESSPMPSAPDSEMEESSPMPSAPDSEMEESSPMPSAPDSEMEESSPMPSAPDSEMEESSPMPSLLSNLSNDEKEILVQQKLDRIRQEIAELAMLGYNVSPITITPTPPTLQDSEESYPLNPIQIAQEVEETDHPPSACSGSCSHGNFPNSFIPLDMLESSSAAPLEKPKYNDVDADKLDGYLDEVLHLFNNSRSNKYLGKPIDDLTKKSVRTEGGKLYYPPYELWSDPANKGRWLLDHKVIVDALNVILKLCKGYVPYFFHCNADEMMEVLVAMGNFRGPRAMATSDLLDELINLISKLLGKKVGLFILDYCGYDFDNVTFLTSVRAIPRLIRKMLSRLREPRFKDLRKKIEDVNSTLDTINEACRITQKYLHPAVCQVIHGSYVVRSVINFSTHEGRVVFAAARNFLEILGTYFPKSVIHDNGFHFCHILQTLCLSEENFELLYLTCIVLYAAFSKLDVARVLEELKNEEAAKKHIGNIHEILQVFGNSQIRMLEYYRMRAGPRQSTFLSNYIEQMNERRSKQSISGQYITNEISSSFTFNSKHVYLWEKCIASIDRNGLQMPCPNICVSKGLCASCKFGTCIGNEDNNFQCSNDARSSDGLCRSCKYEHCSGNEDNNFQCSNDAIGSGGLCRSCKFGKCNGHDDDRVQCKNNARSSKGFCDRHKFGKCIREDNGVQCGNDAISIYGLCEDHEIDYCDRGCGNLATVCVEMITLNIEKGRLGIEVKFAKFADMLLIDKVRSDSLFAGIAKAGDVISSVIINGYEYSKWTRLETFLNIIQHNKDEKKTFVLVRRNREQETISSNSK